jgi:hypothetical protein
MDSVLFQVRSILFTTAAHWLRLTDQVPVELLARRPAPGEWSALDCLCHLLDTEVEVFPSRVRAFLAGQDFPAFDPATEGRDYGSAAPNQLAADFARYRSQSLVLFEQLTSTDLGRTARHAELGPVTLGQLLHEWAAHDLMHTVQAERALMQPFIAGSGPWRSYFTDHDAGALGS